MGTDETARNKADEIKGKVKEAIGHATGNEQWKAEGKADRTAGNVRQAADKAKQAVKDIFRD